MQDWLTQTAARHYWHAFLLAIALVGLWETFAPRRSACTSWLRRWSLHAALFAVTNALTFAALPIGALAAALQWEAVPGGLLNQDWQPFWFRALSAVLLLDAFRYLQHYLLHRAPWLWRLHRAHHSDPDYDLSTALRFHPLEGLVTVSTYLAFLFVLRPPAAAVVVVELLTVAHGLFAHGNVTMRADIDRVVRRFLVTPDLHRVHHSKDISESRSNYGALFPFWDRLFHTYRDQPSRGHCEMGVGLDGVSARQATSFAEALLTPFRQDPQDSVETPAGPR